MPRVPDFVKRRSVQRIISAPLAFLVLVSLAACAGVGKTGCQELTPAHESLWVTSDSARGYSVPEEWIKYSIDPDRVDSLLLARARAFYNPYDEEDIEQGNISRKQFELLDSLWQQNRQRHIEGIQNTWDPLRERLRPGDEVWFYSTPESRWWWLTGQDGIIILRGCSVIGHKIWMQS